MNDQPDILPDQPATPPDQPGSIIQETIDIPIPVPSWPQRKKIIFGSVAVFLWAVLFAAGILIPALRYRVRLGWIPETAQEQQRLQSVEKRLSGLEQKATVPPASSSGAATEPVAANIHANNSAAGNQSPAPTPEPSTPKKETQGPKKSEMAPGCPEPADCSKVAAFLIAMMTFIPINIALLCIAAGFIGGCSVSDELIKDVQAEVKVSKNNPEEIATRRRLNYLTEHPAFSAFRGLVIFLLLTSGLFVFAGSEALTDVSDQGNALGKYIRYAGIFSFIGYIAGHDPTIFSTLLRLGSSRIRDSHRPPGG